MGGNDAHQAYFGISEVIYPNEREKESNEHINTAVVRRLDALENTDEKDLDSRHLEVRLFDSFFSDTLEQKNIRRLVGLVERGYSVQILLFDPFSNLANSRAGHIDSKSLAYRANRGVLGIKKAILGYKSIHDEEKRLLKEQLESFTYLYQQLDEIDAFYSTNQVPEAQRVKIRYTHVYTEAPTYIIGNRVFKGHFFIHKSSAFNPWICSVDDVNRPQDLYYYLNHNFEQLWQSGHSLKSNSRNIFIGYDHDRGTFSSIKLKLYSLQLNPITVEEEGVAPGHIMDTVSIHQKYSNGAIFILSNPRGDGQVRSNVAMELDRWHAHCNSAIGIQKELSKRTVLVIEEGVELSNFDFNQLKKEGMKVIHFTRNNYGCPDSKEWQQIEKALEKLH